MVSCQWSVVSCQWSVVSGQLSVVSCQWSVVSCQLSMVSCQLSRKLPLCPSAPLPLCPSAPLLVSSHALTDGSEIGVFYLTFINKFTFADDKDAIAQFQYFIQIFTH